MMDFLETVGRAVLVLIGGIVVTTILIRSIYALMMLIIVLGGKTI